MIRRQDAERLLEGGNGNPLQYSCLEISVDRGAWQATVHADTKSRTLAFSLNVILWTQTKLIT